MASPTTDRRQGLVGNVAMKAPVTVLAASNITLSGQQTIDGVAVLASNAAGVPDRVLCIGQTDATQNGIWDVRTTAWSRSKDANGNYDLATGSTVLVTQGTTYAGTYWKLDTTGSITIGTTSLSWSRALASALSTLSFLQAGSGAVLRGAQDKMRDIVSVKDFGATGDGVTDDTTAVHAAITYARGVGAAVYFPIGVYRVTSQYTNSTTRANVAFIGPTRTASDINDNLGAVVMLDNASASVAFYEAAASHHLFAGNLRFRANQYATDRAFFRFNAVSVNHRFQNVVFEKIDRPIVYAAGSYFQSSSLIDVQFNDSGTIYSDSNVGSRGNLLTLVNVSHDGSMPANTAKIVCNLQGIRSIQATNFLLEGSLPSTGWEVLRLDNDYEADWTHAPIGQFNGFWSEWTVNSPTYVVHQIGGLVLWNIATFNMSDTVRQYRLEQAAQVRINGSSFNSAATLLNSYFSIEDSKCNVVMTQCSIRLINESDERFTFENCSFIVDGSAGNESLGSALFNTGQASVIYKWDGGYVDGGNATLTMTTGSQTPSTDATYGRKLVLTPVGNALIATFSANLRSVLVQGTQYGIVALIKLPTFTGGTINIQPLEDSTTLSGGAGYDTTYSNTVVKVNIARRIQNAAPTSFGLRITSVATGVVGDAEVYALAFYVGNGLPRVEYPSYHTNVMTYSSAAPSAGTWSRGDLIYNTAPSSGVPVGWSCTVAGTPGTWRSIGTISTST